MQQAIDFREECDVLSDAFEGLSEADWTRRTQFKGWTFNDVLVHLHFWNSAADQALVDPAGFQQLVAAILPELGKAGLRPIENRMIAERGSALLEIWRTQYRDMSDRWSGLDPKLRVKWVGPDMSVRSSITARQMETWAHGMEIFDLLGQRRCDSDRIANVVMLGVNTFGWSHKVQGLEIPAEMPFLRLTAPSGKVWDYGTPGEDERIEGSAVEFAQVVTQTRNIADTALQVTGPVATRWMATAQCFAGPPETPPAEGTRFMAS